jgi:hypothetical protein
MYVPEDEMTKGKTEFVELETSAEPILNNIPMPNWSLARGTIIITACISLKILLLRTKGPHYIYARFKRVGLKTIRPN